MITFILAIILLVSGSATACADPISAAIIGVIGLTGTAATIGTAIVDIGLAIGLSYAAKKLSPSKTASSRGQSINLQISTSPNRLLPVGQVGVGGDLVYWQLSGNHNKTLQMVIALGDVPCDSLVKTAIFVNGKKQTIDDDGFVSGFSNKLKITFHNGDPSQSADSGVADASGGRWTSSEVGKYICYAVVTATYDEKIFASGVPQIVFVVKGAKLYDWRKDSTNGGSGSQRWSDMSTWAFSDNPIVVLYNVLRGISPGDVPLIGMGVSTAAIRLADFTAAANACDEDITLGAGGTEKRYRISALFDTSMTNRDIIEAILASCAGELIESCGIYRPMVGVAQTSVASLTDSDLIIDKPFQSDPKRPRTELYNAVYASYSDPERSYNVVPLPNRTSSDDEEADGGLRLPQTLDLSSISSRTQAQRVMEIARKRARRQLIVSATLRSRWFVLEPGDWITFNSDRRGYSNRVFEIATIKVNSDLTSDVTMREVDDGVDDWSTSDELADNTATDLASAGPDFSSITGIELVTVTIEGATGEQRPGLQITWDAVDDPTVANVALEFRKSGDTVAIQKTILDPTSASYTWVDGVQGGVTYEARLKPITLPDRATDWSSWVTATDSATTPVQIVSQAASVPDGSITPAKLSAQAQLELSLVTGLSSLQGSVNERLDEAIRIARQAAAAAMGIAAFNTTQLRQIRAQSDGNTIGITELLSAIDGAEGLGARWSVSIDVNGNVTGLVQLSGDLTQTQFSVLADKFVIAKPDGTGDPVQVFTIGTLDDDSTGVGINGNLLIKGSVKAEHLDVSSIATLEITDPDDNYFYDFSTGQQGSSDGDFLIDMKNKTIDITF